jgi:hypothetical protein
MSTLPVWFGPMIELVLVLATTAAFLARGVNRYDNYDAAYSRVAFAIGLLPSLVTAVLLITLGRDRARGPASRPTDRRGRDRSHARGGHRIVGHHDVRHPLNARRLAAPLQTPT